MPAFCFSSASEKAEGRDRDESRFCRIRFAIFARSYSLAATELSARPHERDLTTPAQIVPIRAKDDSDAAESGEGRSLVSAFKRLPVFERNTAAFRRPFLRPVFALARRGKVLAKVMVEAGRLAHGGESRAPHPSRTIQ